MKGYQKAIMIALGTMLISPVLARSPIDSIVVDSDDSGGTAITAPPSQRTKGPGYLECVPYARQLSGIQIYGDAHTWWGQAKGRYARGTRPQVGAVMAIRPHGNSRLGHVAAVSRIIDSRTILLSHANWSYPGKIEKNVTALDVSPENDWSKVRIWYGPGRNLGAAHWPVAGFIYNAKPGAATQPTQLAHGPAKQSKRRHADPIGEIIAGTY